MVTAVAVGSNLGVAGEGLVVGGRVGAKISTGVVDGNVGVAAVSCAVATSRAADDTCGAK